MNASKDTSDLIIQQQLDGIAKGKNKGKHEKRLAEEVKRRIAMKRLLITPDGRLASSEDEGPVMYASTQEIDRAAKLTDPNPTDEQKKAGNYRMGHVTIHGLDITIERAKGSTRSGTSKAGKSWSIKMANHYGYIKRTESQADGDHVDVFIGPNPESEIVFVIDQVKKSGRFDEHKCMIGFTNADDAKAAYLANYSAGWTGFGGMKPMPIDQFKKWIDGKGTGKRIQDQRINYAEGRWITVNGRHVFVEGGGKKTKEKPPKNQHPLEGMSKDQIVQHMIANTYAGNNPPADPWNLKAARVSDVPNAAKIREDVIGFVKDAKNTDRFGRPAIKSAFEAMKTAHPDLTLLDFQKILVAMKEDGQLLVSPATLAPAQQDDIAFSFPLNLERKNFLDIPANYASTDPYILYGIDENGYGIFEPRIDFAQAHAPAGGITIGGKHFDGGEWIPDANLKAGTPEEKKNLWASGMVMSSDDEGKKLAIHGVKEEKKTIHGDTHPQGGSTMFPKHLATYMQKHTDHAVGEFNDTMSGTAETYEDENEDDRQVTRDSVAETVEAFSKKIEGIVDKQKQALLGHLQAIWGDELKRGDMKAFDEKINNAFNEFSDSLQEVGEAMESAMDDDEAHDWESLGHGATTGMQRELQYIHGIISEAAEEMSYEIEQSIEKEDQAHKDEWDDHLPDVEHDIEDEDEAGIAKTLSYYNTNRPVSDSNPYGVTVDDDGNVVVEDMEDIPDEHKRANKPIQIDPKGRLLY